MNFQDEFRIQPTEALLQGPSSETHSKNKSKSFKPAPAVGVLVPKYPTYVATQVILKIDQYLFRVRVEMSKNEMSNLFHASPLLFILQRNLNILPNYNRTFFN